MEKEDVKHLEKKLLAYTVAVSAVLLSAPSAEAGTVIYDNGGNGWQTVSPLGPIGGGFLAWDRLGTVNRGGFFGVGSVRFSYLYNPSVKMVALDVSARNGAYINPTRLNSSVIIASGNPFDPTATAAHLNYYPSPNPSTNPYGWNYGWSSGSQGYLGFKFDEGGNKYFGWAEMTTHDASTISLHRLGISDTPGEQVITGQLVGSPVPLPPTLPLLAMGATGLLALRRRKKKQADSSTS